MRWALTTSVACIALTGCSMTGTPMTRPPFETTSPWSSDPSGAAPSAPTPSLSPARWQAIVDDLTERGVEGTPQLVSSRAVTWKDGSLGCPKPGRMYTQALVSGQQVIVAVGERHFDYRFGRTDRPFLCER